MRNQKGLKDYSSVREWIENEWLYYALVIDMDENVFWKQTPKSIQVYFKAFNEKRKTKIQDLWLQGKYFACAIVSTLQFDKNKKPPNYPEIPFKEEVEKDLSKDRQWVKRERERAWRVFTSILGKKNK